MTFTLFLTILYNRWITETSGTQTENNSLFPVAQVVIYCFRFLTFLDRFFIVCQISTRLQLFSCTLICSRKFSAFKAKYFLRRKRGRKGEGEEENINFTTLRHLKGEVSKVQTRKEFFSFLLCLSLSLLCLIFSTTSVPVSFYVYLSPRLFYE